MSRSKPPTCPPASSSILSGVLRSSFLARLVLRILRQNKAATQRSKLVAVQAPKQPPVRRSAAERSQPQLPADRRVVAVSLLETTAAAVAEQHSKSTHANRSQPKGLAFRAAVVPSAR